MTEEPGPTVLVIDGANVVGSVPDGWWRDRAGAAIRLRNRLEHLAIPADTTDSSTPVGAVGAVGAAGPAETLRPRIALVVEGRARDIPEVGSVRVVRAPGSGDDEIVAEVRRRITDGCEVLAVTNDRELRGRIEDAGGEVRRVGWLQRLM